MARIGVVLLASLAAAITGPAGAADFVVDHAVLAQGKLTIRGRAPKPNQVVRIVGTDFKTVSLRSRRFSMVVSYLPDTCKLNLRADDDELQDQVVANCSPRGPVGRQGPPGRDGLAYGSLPGDNAAFKCWTSDVIGLWFIKDYPSRNSRTIAHIVPDLKARGNRLNLTSPEDPLNLQNPEGPAVPQSAEYDNETIHLLDRETKSRTVVRGDVAPDCRSISWKGESDRPLKMWVR
jgi:hypothetical protein